MAITSIKAKTYCKIGPLINGQIATSYVQGSGLIYFTGSLLLSGNFTPTPGTDARLAVAVGSAISSFPINLKVVSSFANPAKQTTKIQLGCALTIAKGSAGINAVYKASTEPIAPENAEEEVKLTLPRVIAASDLAAACLAGLGLSSSAIQLKSKFLMDSYKFSGGYVSTLDALLQSEGFIGWCDSGTFVQVASLESLKSDAAISIASEKIITLEDISSGELPASKVWYGFSSKKLREPTEADKKEGDNSKVEQIVETSLYIGKTIDTYEDLDGNTISDIIQYQGLDKEITTYDRLGRAKEKNTIIWGPWGTTYTNTYYEYQDPRRALNVDLNVLSNIPGFATDLFDVYGEIRKETSYSEGPSLDLARRCGYKYKGTEWEGRMALEKRTVYYKKIGTGESQRTFTIERVWQPFYTTPEGALAIDRYIQNADPSLAATNGLFTGAYEIGARLVLTISRGRTRSEKYFGIQSLPPYTERSAEKFDARGSLTVTYQTSESLFPEVTPDVNGEPAEVIEFPGYDDEEFVEYIGMPGISVREARFDAPFLPDDTFYYKGNGEYGVVKSNARIVASFYAQTQNRLLWQNRNGMSVQLPYDLSPFKPLKPLNIRAGGVSGIYLANGTTYTFDSNGFVTTTDAILLGTNGAYSPPTSTFIPLPINVSPASLFTAPSVTTNTPALPNEVPVPPGFDFENPDLADLFDNVLAGANSDPVYEQTSEVGTILPPYSIIKSVTANIVIAPILRTLEYSLTKPTQILEPRILTYPISSEVAIDPVILSLQAYAPTVEIATATFVQLTTVVLTLEASISYVDAGAATNIDVPLVTLPLSVYAPDVEPISAYDPTIDLYSLITLSLVTYAPTVTGAVAGSVLPATYSQSSVYSSNTAATQSGMQNGNAAETSETGTNTGGPQWIKMDLGSSIFVFKVAVGCDFTNTLNGGWGKTYTEGADIQVSSNDADWTTVANTGSFIQAIQEYSVATTCRYIRLYYGSGYIAATEFKAYSAA